jgi:RNA polymerase sigma-70 factor (ECF subfamily)
MPLEIADPPPGRLPAAAVGHAVVVPGRDSQADFATVYEDQVWRIYGFIAYRVRSRIDAEDLTQLTFERALRAWGRFDPERASAHTWLVSIARNLLIDHYRADRSPRQEPLEDEDVHPLVEGPEHSLGVSPELETALSGLSDRDREVIALRFGGDLTGAEIAEVTGLSVANVQQILSRSLRRLRTALAGDVLDPTG